MAEQTPDKPRISHCPRCGDGLSGGEAGRLCAMCVEVEKTPPVPRCWQCKYDCSGLDPYGRCPECGAYPTPPPKPSELLDREPSPYVVLARGALVAMLALLFLTCLIRSVLVAFGDLMHGPGDY